MIWDSAVFRCINESRRHAPRDSEGKIELNGVVHQFIDRCFFETQALAIRRLLDKETSPGRRSVVSLYRLLDDVERHAYLLTRGNILGALNLPYDYEQKKRELDEGWDGTFMVAGPGWRRCELSKYAHENVDLLAGIDPSRRNPNDVVRVSVLEWLKGRLGKCESIYKFVNKFLAHSASPESRTYVASAETDVTLGQILNAHETICQTAYFIGMNLFQQTTGDPLPVPAGDQFEHFDKPWASAQTVCRLRQFWGEYRARTTEYIRWDWQTEYTRHTNIK